MKKHKLQKPPIHTHSIIPQVNPIHCSIALNKRNVMLYVSKLPVSALFAYSRRMYKLKAIFIVQE